MARARTLPTNRPSGPEDRVEARHTASRIHRLYATAPLPHTLREGLPIPCDGEHYP